MVCGGGLKERYRIEIGLIQMLRHTLDYKFEGWFEFLQLQIREYAHAGIEASSNIQYIARIMTVCIGGRAE